MSALRLRWTVCESVNGVGCLQLAWNFTTCGCCQREEDSEVDPFADKLNRSIPEGEMSSTCVKRIGGAGSVGGDRQSGRC